MVVRVGNEVGQTGVGCISLVGHPSKDAAGVVAQKWSMIVMADPGRQDLWIGPKPHDEGAGQRRPDSRIQDCSSRCGEDDIHRSCQRFENHLGLELTVCALSSGLPELSDGSTCPGLNDDVHVDQLVTQFDRHQATHRGLAAAHQADQRQGAHSQVRNACRARS